MHAQSGPSLSGRIAGAVAGVLLAATLIAFPPDASEGAALDPESCARLKTEQETLDKAGLKDIAAKGPDWAKANLPAEKVNEIRRWIEVDEQLLFRCPGRHLVNLPLEPDPPPPPAPEEKKQEGDPKAEKADSPTATPKPAQPDKKAAPQEKKAPAADKKPPAQRKASTQTEKTQGDTGDTDTPKAQAKAKPKAKPKTKDDAFKPPPSDSANPFGFN